MIRRCCSCEVESVEPACFVCCLATEEGSVGGWFVSRINEPYVGPYAGFASGMLAEKAGQEETAA